jgi:hypothetical protein
LGCSGCEGGFMGQIVQSIATNYYLQAIAIAVAIGTLIVALFKMLNWLRKFSDDVIRVGISKSIRRQRTILIKAAFRDSKDIFLFLTRVTSILTVMIIRVVLIFVISMMNDPQKMRQMDVALTGSHFSQKFYWAGALSVQVLITFLFFSVVIGIVQLRAYVRLVRRRRLIALQIIVRKQRA